VTNIEIGIAFYEKAFPGVQWGATSLFFILRGIKDHGDIHSLKSMRDWGRHAAMKESCFRKAGGLQRLFIQLKKKVHQLTYCIRQISSFG